MNLSALQFPQLRRYLAANVISLNGLWVQRITIGWIAWTLTGSASFVGLIAFLSYIPSMLTGPFFGVMIDRINVRRAALATQSLFCILSFIGFILQSSGYMTPFSLGLIAIIIGIVTSAQHPIRMSFTPRLVPKDHVGSVVVLVALNFNLARVIGPAIGGLIIAKFNVEIALLIASIAYIPAIFTIATLTLRDRIRPNTKSSILADFIEGLHFIKNAPLILKAILITGIFSLTARGALEVLPTIADGGFGKGATGLGVLTASAGIGALLAAISQSFSAQSPGGQLPKRALVAALLGPLVVALLGTGSSWNIAIFAVGLLGFLGTIVGVSMQTSIQVQLDDAIRGRIMSLWIMIALGATALGSVMIGALIDLMGLPLTLQSVGGATALIIFALIRRD